MKTFILLAGAMTLASCATDRKIMDDICSHQIVTRDATNAALRVAERRPDSLAKDLAIDQLHAALDRLDRCPPIGAN